MHSSGCVDWTQAVQWTLVRGMGSHLMCDYRNIMCFHDKKKQTVELLLHNKQSLHLFHKSDTHHSK